MSWPFLQARNYRRAARTRIRLVVLHTMESPEKPNTAVAVARWFAGVLGPAPMASAHLCVDSTAVIECVKPGDIAFAAPGANSDGYQIEHAGRALQDAAAWGDDYSTSMLRLSAEAVAPICVAYGVPPVKLNAADVKAGIAPGFCGHADVSRAFRKSSHTDPGPNFPWDEYLLMVASAVERLNP
jgi:N-acetylmuramoyl-L-alanine amidase-like protein